MMLTSEENNEARENLNKKLLEVMNDRGNISILFTVPFV